MIPAFYAKIITINQGFMRLFKAQLNQ